MCQKGGGGEEIRIFVGGMCDKQATERGTRICVQGRGGGRRGKFEFALIKKEI